MTLVRRRDFLLLRAEGGRRVLELSCEHLYMRYVDARSGMLLQSGEDAGPAPWDGEPSTEVQTPTTRELFDRLERELSDADELRVREPHWLTGEFGREVEARIVAFRRGGGRVESVDPTERRSSTLRHLLLICVAMAVGLGVGGSAAAQEPGDDVLKARVEAALKAASDLPADSITVVVSQGVVTLKGSVVCDECGGGRTPGGSGTIQQSLGAVVRAVPGVRSARFELRYGTPGLRAPS
jgi:hypothetical protein